MRDMHNRYSRYHDFLNPDSSNVGDVMDLLTLEVEDETSMEARRHAMARLLCTLYNLSLITLEQWVREGASPHYDRKGPLGRILCEMGVLFDPRVRGNVRADPRLIQAYCR